MISQSNLFSGSLLNVTGRRVFSQKRAGKLYCMFVSELYLYMERDRRVMVWSKTWRSMEALSCLRVTWRPCRETETDSRTRVSLNTRKPPDSLIYITAWIALKWQDKKQNPPLIASVYRPTNSKVEFLNRFKNFVQNVDKQDEEFMILGYINCDLLPEVKSSSRNRNNY